MNEVQGLANKLTNLIGFPEERYLKKKIKWIIPTVLFIVSLVMLFRPAGKITFDKSVSENRILFQYEIYGCGSVIGKILDGGEEITAAYVEEYPNIGINEVVFLDGTDEPSKHMDYNTMGGYGSDYVFVIEGEPVGVTKGAPECCDPKPAYNENVVEFKVDKWYFTAYVPFVSVGDFDIILLGCLLTIISIIWVIILALIKLYQTIKAKRTCI